VVQCYDNIIRPHLALKFGRVCKTPAMQAGLAVRPLSFRDIFGAVVSSRPSAVVVPLTARASVPARSVTLLAA